jgi:hypothetical protein
MFRHVTTRVSGLIILIAGVWGGLIPFLGPTFNFTLGPNVAWHWTTGRLWLSVLPAIAAVLGGLILMGGGPRLSGKFGALLALAGGVWFAVGPDVSMLWNHGISQQGIAHGRHTITRMLEYLTLHSGIGVLITAFAAFALPGLAGYRRHAVERDAALAGAGAAAAGSGAAAAPRRRGLFGRRRAVAEPVATGPAAAGTAAAPAAAETPAATEAPATTQVGREPVAPVGNGAGNGTGVAPGAGNGTGVAPGSGVAAEPADGTTQTVPRRRGGLFSRR